jgi:wyosine [tRNA(Phe)-imidazoG37] synthetase (radical SAM superfamily)
MIREETVFGPIFSRRLGTSLGINLLPQKGKICNFDCIYCECGWNKDGRNDTVLPTAAKVRADLENMLEHLRRQEVKVDSITFSGDGEPTLNPEFPQIIDDTLALRDHLAATAKVSVLSNATRVHLPEVFCPCRLGFVVLSARRVGERELQRLPPCRLGGQRVRGGRRVGLAPSDRRAAAGT